MKILTMLLIAHALVRSLVAGATECPGLGVGTWAPVPTEVGKYQTFAVLEYINVFNSKQSFELFAVPPARVDAVMSAYRAEVNHAKDGFSMAHTPRTMPRLTLLVRREKVSDMRYSLFLMEEGERFYPIAEAHDVPLALDVTDFVLIPWPHGEPTPVAVATPPASVPPEAQAFASPRGPVFPHAPWESLVDRTRIAEHLSAEFARSQAVHVTAYAVPPVDAPHTLAVVAALPNGAAAGQAFDPKPHDTVVVVHETAPDPLISVYVFPEDTKAAPRRIVTNVHPREGHESDALQDLVPGAFEDDEFDVERVLDVLTGSATSIPLSKPKRP